MGAFDLQDIPQLVYLGAIFVAVLGYAIAAHRRNLGRLLRHSALWFFIIIGTVAAKLATVALKSFRIGS